MNVGNSAFSLDEQELALIEQKFEEKKKIGKAREKELFGVFEEKLTEEESLALKFLYAYMPLNDMADYDGSLFLKHVRRSLETRKQMPWGMKIPDRIFLYFVLPYRVNNENIEDYRGVIYDELAERTKHLPMTDAILEANYWCHEKATYIGSDMRTLSPLSMMRNARGRCGEESTLAVSALRSIGIPARQCYTPRWAHCDDNHAWVEAWADGKWYFIGACEPEPRLNQGWFSGPARRAMLVHTRVPAGYSGPETITSHDEWHTEINLLENYAPTRVLKVVVRDGKGGLAGGARVLFQLYNYAELYPLADVETNEHGEAQFKTGYGDLVIRAVKDGIWGQKAISVRDGEEIEIVLDQTAQPEQPEDFDMVPPPEIPDPNLEPLSEEHMQGHEEKVTAGVNIRKAYEETFMSEKDAAELAEALGLDSGRVWKVLGFARGNSREIAAFLKARTPEYGEWPLVLLESMEEKDMIDAVISTLDDHLIGSLKWRDLVDPDTFTHYVLCPRVQYEMIAPYRQILQSSFTKAEAECYRANPSELVELLKNEWEIRDDLTHLRGKATPRGTFQLRKGDLTSVEILFVALCRSLGIPARLHPSEQKPQYLAEQGWQNAVIREICTSEKSADHRETGKLQLLLDPEARTDAPAAAYEQNFTIARLENGVYKTLLYEFGKTDVYDEPFEVEPGDYRVTTGIRQKDGTVLGRWHYTTIRPDEESKLTLTFREPSEHIPVLGTADLASPLQLPEGSAKSLGELAGTKGAIVAWLEPDREPSKHLLREAGELAESIEAMGIPVIFAVGDDKWTASFNPTAYVNLPSGVQFVRDSSYCALQSFASVTPLGVNGFPHLFVLDGDGRIRYKESGYKPGSGKEALKVLSDIEKE